jgi:hypothetical protein
VVDALRANPVAEGLTVCGLLLFCFVILPATKNLLKGLQSESTEEIRKIALNIANGMQENVSAAVGNETGCI